MRTMKLWLTVSLAFIFSACAVQKPGKRWIQLFNGKDLKDWDIKITGHELNDNNGNTFRVQDGKLVVSYENYKAFDEQYGHIFHKRKFSAYLLVMEYRFVGDQVAGGPGWAFRNSGAMIHSQSAATMGKDQDFPISIEVQLLGGTGKGKRSTANLCTPGTNVVMNDKLITAHCIDSKSKTYDGDQWVTAEVLVLGDSIVKHIVEKDTVLVYEKPQIGGGNVSHADPSLLQAGKLLNEGYIALQSESHPVEYRKVALFDLAPYMNDKEKLEKVIRDLQTR
ncbi:3-keto-disaccharide hydrolase [Chitinophaga cymbidii]|uniref:3-keto-alpha-glucoside-1,2-lyase/3-keto-2-hydroxy-glucal hydratase domain-containing protein n=1 Tax=Chitinophaga cymbidii TaxID=1096750 RepID=A0A512RDK8_9BACT|nr:DUF1080 domain-containing protein [Chitinophaga cymbidii]GEP93798.1 hypothetical protein CCY01nite_00580 [Chitinophaga cymbidii]